MSARDLERAYRIALWKDDPWTPEGRERYRGALEAFRKLLEHPWFKELVGRREVSVVDIGAGRGIGGVALAKVLMERGLSVRLVMVDVRRDAVRDSLKFAGEEGVAAEAYEMDALKVHTLGEFDLALMYGAILPHFDAWQFPRLLASTTAALKDDGVVVIEEMDRIHYIFRAGYKDFIVENPKPEEVSFSVHSGYDPVRGTYKRTYIRARTWESVTVPLVFRSISCIASTLWLFVEDVDLVRQAMENLYFVLGRRPRRALKPEDLENNPALLRKTMA